MRAINVLGGALLLVVSATALVLTGAAPASASDPSPESCSRSGPVITCRIDDPDVAQPSTDYPGITFDVGDRVSVQADGCVQTGGAGSTWKRYVNPQGPNSGDLYHGLVGFRAESGMDQLPLQRFEQINGQTFTVAKQAHLELGYEDDDFSDNGYWGHDDGTGDQCAGGDHGYGGDAFVVISIDRPDTDGDGLSDWIEQHGITRPDGTIDTWLPDHNADPCRKTVAVEADWLTDGVHSDQPPQAALDEAVTMFDNGPLPAVTACPHPGFPARNTGVQLLVDSSDGITVTATQREVPLAVADSNGVTPFETYRSAHFTPDRRNLFHYSLWGFRENLLGNSGVTPYVGSKIGPDFMVTVGSWNAPDDRIKSGTFVHELGHALGLLHGGDQYVNYKPNYLSAMNYTYQLTGIPDWSKWIAAVALPDPVDYGTLEDASTIDYSRKALSTLDKSALDETVGIGTVRAGTDPTVIWRDPVLKLRAADGDKPVDWNENGSIDHKVRANVNVANDVCITGAAAGLTTTPSGDDQTLGSEVVAGPDATCDTKASPSDTQTQPVGYNNPTILTGYDDWDNLAWTMGAEGAPASGQTEPAAPDELNEQQANALRAELLHAMIEAAGSDLSTEITAPTAPVAAGTTFPVTLQIRNGGPADASHVAVHLSLPEGVTVAASDERCDSGGTCTLGALPSRGTTTIGLTLEVTPSFTYPQSTRPLSLTATVTLDGIDPQTANNRSTVTVPVESVADVSASATLPPMAQIPVGSTRTLPLTAVLANAGPSGPVDAGWSLTTSSDPGIEISAEQAGGLVTLDRSATAKLSPPVNVHCTDAGLHHVTVTLSASTPHSRDPLLGNNTTTSVSTVDCTVGILALGTGNGQGAETVDENGSGTWTFTAGGLHSNGGVLIQQSTTMALQNGATITTSTRTTRCTQTGPGCPPAGTVTGLRAMVADPLAALPEPGPGLPARTAPPCDSGQTCGPLLPGHYTGPININGGTVLMEPGTYVFDTGSFGLGGRLMMAPDAASNEGVTLIFPRGSALNIRGGGQLRLRPPLTGPYAGILVMYTRDNTATLGWRGSNSVITVNGGVPTVYAPSAALQFDSDAPYSTPVRFIVSTVSNQGTTIRFAQ